jgi:hypothetical protein
MSKAFDYFASFSEGAYWAGIVADRLKLAGVQCWVPDPPKDKPQEWITRHEKDICLPWTDQPLEVKARTKICDHNGQLIYDPLFIDTVYGYDMKAVKPLAYVMVCKDTANIWCISPRKTQTQWDVDGTFDTKRKINITVYTAAADLFVPYTDLVDFLISKQQ